MKNTVKELLDNCDSETINGFFESEYEQDYYTLPEDRKAFDDADIKVEHVDNYGGEDQGSEYWSVYKFTKGADTVFVRFQGYYASYVGSEFHEWFFVEPKEKTITVYEA